MLFTHTALSQGPSSSYLPFHVGSAYSWGVGGAYVRLPGQSCPLPPLAPSAG